MINFDSVTLRQFIKENVEFLSGARVQKIQQPTRREFLFYLRNFSETRKFYVNINPQFYHLCFVSAENEEKRLLEVPKQPPMFCMLLRKYLENSKIVKVVQPEYERILELYVETYNELSEKIYLCLAIELMGKHSNVVLYNHDTNVIIGCAHNVGAEKSREREMMGGLPYVYPPRKNSFWYGSENTFANGMPDINSRIDNYYAEEILKDKFKKLQEKYILITSQKLKKIETSLIKMKRQTVSTEKAENYRKLADLIMANLYNNSDFSKSIEVFDWQTNQSILIDLDETKTLKDNANRYYRLYNKAKTSNQKLAELSSKLLQEKEYIEQLLYFIVSANRVEELYDISSEVEPEEKKNVNKKVSTEPIKIEGDSYTIFIGKNNKQNDYIVSKLARNEDIWFHTHNCAGSHVLLRTANLTDEQILMCAKIAKEHSQGANSSKIGVIYTHAKYLKKPPAANLGYVTYSNEKEIIID